MGSGRWVVVVLLAAAGSVFVHPRVRTRCGDAMIRVRLWGLFESRADRIYSLAERQFQAADFEKAQLTCERALKLNPSHAPARALHMEVQFILASLLQVRAPPNGGEDFISQIRHSQTLVEIDNAFERAERSMERAEGYDAEREFRKVLEYAKWMPVGVEINRKCERARCGLAHLESQFQFPP